MCSIERALVEKEFEKRRRGGDYTKTIEPKSLMSNIHFFRCTIISPSSLLPRDLPNHLFFHLVRSLVAPTAAEKICKHRDFIEERKKISKLGFFRTHSHSSERDSEDSSLFCL